MPVREAIRDVQHAHAVTFDAIGTRWSIRSDYPLDTETITRVRERIDEFDRCYSRFRDDSYVCMVAGHPGQWPLPADAAPMFALYDRLDEITGGAVNPLVGSRMEFLGYDSSYRLRPAGAVTTQRTPRWTEHVVWGDGVLRTTPGVGVIDVGAIGKGYLIDLVGGVLRSAGHQDWLIDAGGDILASGRPRRIGLEHPYRLGEVIGVVTIQDEAICASGTARRAWGTDCTTSWMRAMACPCTMYRQPGLSQVLLARRMALPRHCSSRSRPSWRRSGICPGRWFGERRFGMQTPCVQKYLRRRRKAHPMRKKCEALWGNITMYHLVALGLMLLTIQAFVLSGLSAIYFTPAQLLASVIVLVAVSYLANRIFAAVMRVRPHSESAVITGLILFFVTTPMTVPADLLTLAAVAAVAVASKYVITYHGRHILNPAAAGMAVIAATGLGWSAWWIGTPSAFALVVVCGAAIAYRVRMLGPAVAYLGVAVGVYTLFLVVGGAVSLPQAISFAVLSSAFPFVAGFMLTEPLTLPNSRRSRYGVAVVAGVLCGWPLSVSWPIGGSLTFGPEWAILVGNLLAWGSCGAARYD